MNINMYVYIYRVYIYWYIIYVYIAYIRIAQYVGYLLVLFWNHLSDPQGLLLSCFCAQQSFLASSGLPYSFPRN